MHLSTAGISSESYLSTTSLEYMAALWDGRPRPQTNGRQNLRTCMTACVGALMLAAWEMTNYGLSKDLLDAIIKFAIGALYLQVSVTVYF